MQIILYSVQKPVQMRWQPAVRVAAPYYEDPAYIGALARSMRSPMKVTAPEVA